MMRRFAPGIRSDTPKVCLFAIVHGLMGMGFCFGFYSANALLVSRIGIAPLFYIYSIASLAALIAAACFYYGTVHLRRTPLVYCTFLGTGALVCAWWIAVLHFPTVAGLYIGMRACFYAIFVVNNLAFWLCASETFNNFEARRGFPILVAAGVVGELLGGWITNSVAVQLHAVNLILGWGLILWCCPLLLWAIPAWFPSVLMRTEAAHPVESGSLNLPVATKPLLVARLTLCLFVFWFAYSFLCYGTDFLFNALAIQTITQEDQLTAFFGRVTFLASAAILGYQLLVAGPLATRFGIDRAIIIIPLAVVLSLLGYVLHPSLATIAIAQGAIFFFADYAAVGLLQPLLTVYPLTQRGAVRVWTEGVGRPLGTLGLLACSLLFIPTSRPTMLVPMLVCSAFLFLGFPVWFHRAYIRHLLRCLRAPDREVVVNAIQALGERNKTRAARPLLRLLMHADDVALKQTVVLSLAQMQSMEAFRPIVALFSVRDESLQMAVVRALSQYKNYEGMFALFRIMKSRENVSFEVRMNATQLLARLVGKKIIPFLMDLLEDRDLRIVANAIEAIGVVKDRKTVRTLRPYLQHPNHRVRANAAIALYSFHSTRPAALKAIDALYHARTPIAQHAGLYAIGTLQLTHYRDALHHRLEAATDKHLRHYLTFALAQMADPVFCEPFLRLLLDHDAMFARDVAKRLGTMPRTSRLLVFEHLAHLATPYRARIYETLEHTHLDFTWEKRMISARKVMPAPVTI